LSAEFDDNFAEQSRGGLGFARLGIQQVWVNPTAPGPAAWARRVGEHVPPKLRKL